MTAVCVVAGCDRPTDGYACVQSARELGDALIAAAGHAEDASAVIARQARYSAGSQGGTTEPLPVDFTASTRLGLIANTIGGWARIVVEETGRRPRWRPLAGPLCPPTGERCTHGSCEALRRREAPPALALEAAWLAQQVGWLRRHPAAAEAFRDLHKACEDLARLVDRPPDKDLIGVCDCGKVLYAPRGETVVRCPEPTCRLKWNVEESRGILRRALDGKLVDAYQATRLAAYLDSDRSQDAIRKLIDSRIRSGQLVAHGVIDGEPVYRFGEIVEVLASIQRRNRGRARVDAA